MNRTLFGRVLCRFSKSGFKATQIVVSQKVGMAPSPILKGVKAVVGCLVLLTPAAYVGAHCEIPCGIYDDARQFSEMREDAETIAKAVAGIVEQCNSMNNGAEPLAVNQVTRWVDAKESHASNIQHSIAQYFMTQRIKADDPKYVVKLTAAHGVMVAAMKCKQNADKASVETLRKTIGDFEKAYGG